MLGWVLLLYAVVQGVTEFLPVSSSGHLELLGIIVGAPAEPLLLATWLHLATALAALAYHRRTCWFLVRSVRRAGGARRFVVRWRRGGGGDGSGGNRAAAGADAAGGVPLVAVGVASGRDDAGQRRGALDRAPGRSP